MEIKGYSSEDANWHENAESLPIFPVAGFVRLVYDVIHTCVSLVHDVTDLVKMAVLMALFFVAFKVDS